MQKIRWGIVGAGAIANKFAADFSQVKMGELVAVASRDLNRAAAFAEAFRIPQAYGSYAELYNDPGIDAIYIATPHNFHKRDSLDAINAGKAVLCEKPITTTPEEFQEVREAARRSGTYLMEGMWTYFLPTIQTARAWVASGRIGRVMHIKANFGFQASFDPKGRLFDSTLAGGALLDVGIYPIAMAWLFLRQDPKDIVVKSTKAATGVDEDTVMCFAYGEAFATLHCSIRYSLPNHAVIIGEDGYIHIPDFWHAKECFLFQRDEEEPADRFLDQRDTFGFNYEIEAVNSDLLAGKKESEILPHDFSMKFQQHMQLVRQKF